MTVRDLAWRHHAPALPSQLVVVLAILFAVLTVVRGFGWITASDISMSPVVHIGLSRAWLTTDRWGAVLVATGIVVIVSYAARIHVLVWLAHGLAAIVYLTVATALALAVVDLGSGWQHVGAPIGGFVWHSALAWLTGPLPPHETGVHGAHDTR